MAFSIAQADEAPIAEANHVRIRKFGEKYLLTADHGAWVFLNKDEFRAFQTLNFTNHRELKHTLKDKGIIIDHNNIDDVVRMYKERYGFLWQGTSLHIIVLTLRCNLKCVYCHAGVVGEHEPNHDMSMETAKKTVDFMFQSPTPVITIEFQGGEPTLNWDVLKYIVDYARELNKKHKKQLHIDLVTNLTKMTEEKAKWLIDNNIGICTSFDGNQIVHNRNRGKHDDVTLWIERINKMYAGKGSNQRVNALMTTTRSSLNHVKDIIDEYVRLGIRFIHLRPLNKLGFADKHWEHISYSTEEFLKFWREGIEYIIEKDYDIVPRGMHLLLAKILNKGDPNYTELRTPCGAATGQLTYNHDGKVFTCDEGRMVGDDTFEIGDVHTDTYKEVLTRPKTTSIINASVNDGHICDTCAYKPYCGLCPVCNYKEQGSTIAKVPETSRCQIHMGQFTYIFESLLNSPKTREKFLSWLSLERPEQEDRKVFKIELPKPIQ
ncbi:MAG: His-Xaa-Ser system radical SAM maturase HxsB [Candidatus Nanoarchaeia archaeon]